jgi:diketogulonate reductase-like aldo/keto reductase
MLRWSVQHGNIVIPKSVTRERIRDNMNIFDFELASKDLVVLDGLNEDYRTVKG